MRTIEITADEELVHTLEVLAQADSKSLEDLSREVLSQYAKQSEVRDNPRRFSFIGIGHSGRSDLSTRVERTLAEAANRREGWSLPD